MKVRLYAEIAFDVDVDIAGIDGATRAVLANWDTVYKRRATPVAGYPSHVTRIIQITAAPKEAPAVEGEK
jgi:hypothetical protein